MHSGGRTVQTPQRCSWREGEWWTSPLPCSKAWPSGQQNCACTTCSLPPARQPLTLRAEDIAWECQSLSPLSAVQWDLVPQTAPPETELGQCQHENSAKLLSRSRDMVLWPWTMAPALVEWGRCLSWHSQGNMMGRGLGRCTCKSVPSNHRHGHTTLLSPTSSLPLQQT